jgi:hypothetical protein
MEITEETKAEMLRQVNEAARVGGTTNFQMPGAKAPGPAGVTTGPGAGADPQAFTAADLETAARSELLECREIPMPGGKRAFVFGMSGFDFDRFLAHRGEHPTEVRDQALQVALTLYQDRAREHPCFHVDHADNVRAYLKFPLIQRIVRESNELTGGPEVLGPAIRSFLKAARTSAETWLSRLNTVLNCPPGLLESVTEFESAVSRLLSQGIVDGGMIYEGDDGDAWPETEG